MNTPPSVHPALCHSRPKFRLLQRFVALAIAACLFTGCMSNRTVARRELAGFSGLVLVGDEVVCSLRDGTTLAFTVTTVEPTLLAGEHQRVALAEVDHLAIRRFSALRTGALVGGLGLAGLLVALDDGFQWKKPATGGWEHSSK